MKKLVDEIKQMIVAVLNLEDMKPSDIDETAPLFGDGLGLDSIDALELGVALQKTFGVKIDATSEDTRRHFYSVQTLADFVTASGAVARRAS